MIVFLILLLMIFAFWGGCVLTVYIYMRRIQEGLPLLGWWDEVYVAHKIDIEGEEDK